MKKFPVFMAICLLLLLGGFSLYTGMKPNGANAQWGGGEMPPMPVPIIVIAEKPVSLWKEFSGKIMAVDYVEIRPQVTGIIKKIHFTDGQIVKKGDLLYTIDPRPYEAAVAQARALVTAAQEESGFAEAEKTRADQLLATGAISKAGYDARVNTNKISKSAIAGANGKLKEALVNLDHTTIEAPIAGRIGRAEITEGNLVSPTANIVLTTIVSNNDVYADFEVDEQTYLSFVRAKGGSSVEEEKSIPVRLRLANDTADAAPYDGTIKSFDNIINPSSGTIRARAIFANTDGALLPGMFAQIQIGAAQEENRITVPTKAIQTDQSRKFVYVVEKDVATYREVKAGDSIGNEERVILSGLAAGDKVIIDGFMKLRAGAKVQGMTAEEMAAMKEQMAKQIQGGAQQGGEAPPEKAAQ